MHTIGALVDQYCDWCIRRRVGHVLTISFMITGLPMTRRTLFGARSPSSLRSTSPKSIDVHAHCHFHEAGRTCGRGEAPLRSCEHASCGRNGSQRNRRRRVAEKANPVASRPGTTISNPGRRGPVCQSDQLCSRIAAVQPEAEAACARISAGCTNDAATAMTHRHVTQPANIAWASLALVDKTTPNH